MPYKRALGSGPRNPLAALENPIPAVGRQQSPVIMLRLLCDSDNCRSELMRKSKDIKRKRRNAAEEYRKGKRVEAYKLWYEAAAEYRARRQPASKGPETPAS